MTTPPGRDASPARLPVRRPRPARGVKTIVAAIGLMFAVHVPAVQRWLSPMLERAASAVAGGALTFTTLEFQLVTGHVRGEGIRLVRPGLEMTAAAVDFQFRPLRGSVLRALEPRVVITRLSDPRADRSSDQQPWMVLSRFAEIEIVRGVMRLQDRDASPVFQMGGVEAHVTRTGHVAAGTVVANEIAVSRDGRQWRGSADARVEIDLQASGAAHVRSLRIRAGPGEVQLSGTIQQLNPLVAQMHVALPRGLDLVRAFAPQLSAEGEITANADFTADRSGHRATIRADVTAVRVARIGPWDGRIQAHVEGDVLRVVDIDLSVYGGTIRGSGAASFGKAAGDLRLQVRGLDIAKVLASHTDFGVRVGSRADADVVLRLPQPDLRTWTSEATVAFRPLPEAGLPLRGSATLTMHDRNVHVSSRTLAVRGADLRLHGAVGLDGRVNLRYGVHLPDLGGLNLLLADAGVAMPRVNLRGALQAEGVVQGSSASWLATATVASRRSALEEIDLDVESELRLTPARLDLVRLNATGADGALSAHGVIPVSGTGSWNVAGRIPEAQIDRPVGVSPCSHRRHVERALRGHGSERRS